MEKIRLGSYVEIDSGYAFKSALFNENEGLPIIRIRDVTSGSVSTYYSGEYDEKYLVKNNDLLISMDGSFIVRKWLGGNALLNQRVCRIKSKDHNIILDDYIYRVLPKYLKNIEDKTSFVTVKHLSVKDINEIEVYLPNLVVQKMIIDILDKAQSLIDKRKEQIEACDELVKSLFYEMFGDPVKNDKGWKISRLDELGRLERGKSKHRPRNAPELLNGPYPLIQTGDVSNAGLYITNYTSTYSEVGLKQSKMWPSGTLCITIAANIAKTAILTFDACFPDSVVGFTENESSNKMFIQIWMTFLQQMLEETAPESAQKNINLKILNELSVITPPLSLQNKFAAQVKKIEHQKNLLEQSLKELENNFNSLMQRAFKGELF